MDNHYKRGSEWRKWDLHVHSPNTFLSNNFNNCSNDDFIKKVKVKGNNISVIGLTNYFKFDDNDFKLKDELENQGLKVFLNLELRLTYQNKEDKNCDLHIIFSDDLTKETIQQFLSNLTLKVDGTEKKANNLESENDFEKATVEFSDLLKQLNAESLNLKDKYLLGFLSRGRGNGRSASQYENLAKQCNFIIHSSDKNENLKNDRKFWLEQKKPLLQSSDAHKLDDIGNKFTWIKADPTFEGLKQIIYEPEARVRIQENKPEEKASYKSIKSIEINHNDCKQTIEFNPNLNTIIGGRSTGKSTLLKIIAGKLKRDNPQEKEDYIKGFIKDSIIEWQDNEKDKNEREIEYFEQSYMYNIASNNEKKDELIGKIVKHKDVNNLLDTYKKFCENNGNNIQGTLDQLFNIQDRINQEREILKNKGDKKGVENEIQHIQEKIKKLGNKNFTEENFKNFEEIKNNILEKENTIKKIKNDLSIIEKIKSEQLFNNSVSYNFGELLMVKKEVNEKFEEIKQEFKKKWHEELDNKKEELNKKIKELEGENEKTKDEEIYKKGLQYLEENKQHKELDERLKKEKEKLEKIRTIEEKIEENKKSKKELFEKIIQEHIKYKNEIDNLIKEFNLEHEDIKIKITKHFKDKECREELKSYLHLKGHENQKYLNCFVDSYQDKMEETIKEFLNKNLEKSIPLKNHKDYKELSKSMITKNWFFISYKLTYENDSFEEMSEGKKAFVVLKLLLDFSKKQCPILIDQPEDSLDNRAIYNELVKYIRKKKIERQIMLVTHNANVVVNADAEEVIVANQNGEQSKNENGIKFQYVSGSLEHTKNKDKNNKNILNSQGIKEHVCEILEGGKDAFEKRKQKYNIQ